MVRFDSRMLWFRVRLGVRPSTCLALSILTLSANSAWAQSDPEPSPEYEAEVDAALADHEAGRFEAAREHFLRAHSVFPNARTLRGLGKVEFELRNYADAFRHLEAAQSSPVRSLSDELRDEVAALIARAREHLGQVALDVRPESARIVVDGVMVANGPHVELVLAEGPHVLELSAPNRLNERRPLTLRPGQQLELLVELREVELAVAQQPLAPPARQDVPAHRKWWVWTVSGVALAGTVTAAVLLATREHDKPSPFAGAAFVESNP